MDKWQSLFTIPLLGTILPAIIFQSFNIWPKKMDLVGISHQEQRQNTKPRSYSNATEGNVVSARPGKQNEATAAGTSAVSIQSGQYLISYSKKQSYFFPPC